MAPSDVYAGMALASGDRIRVLMALCQNILDGKGMSADWDNQC